MTEIEYEALCGSTIVDTINSMITEARQHDALVKTNFNGVTVVVDSDSDPDLIYRDWSRAMSGCIGKTVGPHPRPTLTPEEVASDARVEAANEQRRKEQNAQYQVKIEAKRIATESRLASAPPMAVADDAAWQSWKDSNTDGYGSGIIRYAETWARLMQADMADGAALEDIADATSHEADVEGITGFMHGAAVQTLARCWVHGDLLRKWHNRKWGVGEDVEGTVNPAVFTVNQGAGDSPAVADQS